MLKKNLNEYSNIFDDLNKHWPILTAGEKDNANSMGVSWGGIGVLWGKTVGFVFVRHSRYTHEFIEKYDSVTLSFLDDKYNEQKKVFGSKSGRDTNKLLESGLNYTFDPDFNGYYITESSFVFKMKKLYSVELPYDNLPQDIKDRFYNNGDQHTMYVCEIKQFLVNGE